MTQIAIAQRRQLPAGTAGRVKPPLSLADQSGLQALGGTVAKIGFAAVKSIAANEESVARGQVNTLIESYSTFTAANPNASMEELQTEWGKISQKINTIPNTLKTGEAQRNMQNFLSLNEGAINKRAQTSMLAVKSKQELVKSEAIRDSLILNRDAAGLVAHDQAMTEAGTYDPEIQPLRTEQDLAVINKANEKIAINNAVGIGFQAWESTVTPEDPDGNLNAAFDVIESLDVPEGDKQEIESELKTRVNNRRAEAKLQAEQDEVESDEKIAKRLNDGELAGIDTFIKSLPLTEIQKLEKINTANSYVKSINDARANFITSDATNIEIDRIVKQVRDGDLTYDQGIDEYSQLASVVNAKEGEGNLNQIRAAADNESNPVLKRPEVVRGLAVLERSRAAAVRVARKETQTRGLPEGDPAVIGEIEARFLTNKAELDKWAIDNADDPQFTKKWQDQVNLINTPIVETVTLGVMERFFRRKEGVVGVLRSGLIGLVLDTEEEALVNKKFEALESLAVFQNLDTEERNEARQAFANGFTVQDVVNELKNPTVNDDSIRPDGTKKDIGFLGTLKIGGELANTDAVATEFSVQANAVKVNGERIDFPTLVPTLTQSEIDLMLNDIIPNDKPIPESIMQKAIAHAKKRLRERKSVFFEAGE